VLSQGLLKTLE